MLNRSGRCHICVRHKFIVHKFIEVKSAVNVDNRVFTIQEVAVKMEPVKARHPQLLYESKLYKILAGGVGIPQLKLVLSYLS